MRRLLGYLIVTALVVTAAVWLADQPDQITERWQGWRIDTKIPVLAIGLPPSAPFELDRTVPDAVSPVSPIRPKSC